MKKVLAIMGGARKKHNTEYILEKYLEGMKSTTNIEVTSVYLDKLKMGHCIGCLYCEKTGKCFQKDDMENMYDLFDNSDCVVLASPIYFNNMSSFVKTMIDRCQVFWSSKYVLKKSSIDRKKKRYGALLCVAGAPYEENKYFGTEQVADLFFKSINTQFKDRLFKSNTDIENVWDDKVFCNEVYKKGSDLLKDF